MLADLVFNALLGGIEIAALARSPPARRPVVATTLFALGLALSMVGGVVFGRLFLPMRLLSWVLFAHLPALLVAVALVGRARWPAALAGALLVVGADAFLVEPQMLRVHTLEVQAPTIKRDWTIAFVADIQTDRVGDYERMALLRAMATRPDLVLFAGDYLQIHDDDAYEAAIPSFRALLREAGLEGTSSPPAYAVQGNMEWRQSWITLFEGTSVLPVVETTTFRHEELAITALSFAATFGREPKPAPEQGFQILFGHAPDFALDLPPGDLLLAGHTHGGQVRLPWVGPLITFSRVPRAWASGLTPLGEGRSLYVSRGVGLERGDAPRLRFACLPELTIIRLSPGEPRAQVVD